ncbi:hypothetical protein [Nocardia sp. NPDC127526]|uniref:hypothetical protein n=1 Tax=Nocardia sp. NPDC127526 TaxID=3345393 RepID=UPI0036435452
MARAGIRGVEVRAEPALRARRTLDAMTMAIASARAEDLPRLYATTTAAFRAS